MLHVKAAVIFYVPNPMSSTVYWRWRAVDGTADSPQSFEHYRDCLTDAQANGYDVETVRDSVRVAPIRTFSAEQRAAYEAFLAVEPGPTRH